MTSGSSSPRRRHILSSINPETRSVSPHHSPAEPQPQDVNVHDEGRRDEERHDEEQKEEIVGEGTSSKTPARKTSKFRFKSKHSRPHRSSRRSDERDDDAESESNRDGDRHGHHHHHHRRRHHSHHRHKRRRTRSRSPTPPNPYDPPPLDAEAAFRESLFDAMADDEGAAYWEGVYGQPIHVYGRQERARGGPDGELERMDDDEYAAYVRQKMWEKTHQGLLEERARREEQRQRKDRDAEAAARLTAEMERSLRRGEERRAKRGWKERWDAYVESWEAWDGSPETMVWPVSSGRREDVEAAMVREFFVLGIDAGKRGETEFLARLKDERVRWHPDKMQQRLGGRVDEGVMRAVTAVFQIVDKLWTDTRSKQADR
ncbi:hypothetical protein F5Y14DRAFT_400854 [Nemania sp. NC0429]|nr:hypothetical protein F5Y14DRAFT_400854 [Nemania sp. NC0429]